MKNIKAVLLIVMTIAAGAASAQYMQEKPNVEVIEDGDIGKLIAA